MLMTARSPLLSMRARSAYPALSNAREAGADRDPEHHPVARDALDNQERDGQHDQPLEPLLDEADDEVRGDRVGQQPDLDPGAEHDPRRAAGEEAEQQDLDGQVRLPRATEDEEDRAHRDEERADDDDVGHEDRVVGHLGDHGGGEPRDRADDERDEPQVPAQALGDDDGRLVRGVRRGVRGGHAPDVIAARGHGHRPVRVISARRARTAREAPR